MYITTDSVPASKLLAHHHLSLRWGQLICKGLMPCDISSNERSSVFGLWRQGNVRRMTGSSQVSIS